MPCDKGVLNKRKGPKRSLKCAPNQRGPSNVPKEKHCPQKPSNKLSQVCANKKWAKKIQKSHFNAASIFSKIKG
jgi:hypothetical protein